MALSHFLENKKKEIFGILIVATLTALFYFPIIKNLSKTAIDENDWWRNVYNAGLSRKSIVQYHQLPLRTPFLGGGYPLIGRPSDLTLSPFFIFILIFDEVRGLRVLMYFIFIMGALGMFYLTYSVLKYDFWGGVFSSLTFSLCNWGIYELVDGNLEKTYYYLLPWIMAFFIRSKCNKIFIVFTIFVSSIILFSSALTLFPIYLFVFLFACINSIEIKKGLRIVVNSYYLSIFLVILVTTFCLCAVKILPFLQLYSMRIKDIHSQYGGTYQELSCAIKAFGSCLNFEQLQRSLLDPAFRGYSVMYLGIIPLITLLLSVLIYRKYVFSYIILLIIFILIEFGPNSPIDLYKALWALRPFGHTMFRLDKYFGFFIPFCICLVGGSFFWVFKGKGRLIQASALIIIIFSVGNMYWHNRMIFRDIIYTKIPEFKKYNSFFQAEFKKAEVERKWPNFSEIKDLRSYQLFWILLQQNIGLTDFNWKEGIKIKENALPKYTFDKLLQKGECVYVQGYENISDYNEIDLVQRGKVNPLYKAEAFFTNDKNEAVITRFSPNVIDINFVLNNPGKLIINQNYHKSWKTNKGKVIDYQGLLGVDLSDKGIGFLRLSYVPLDFFVGLFLSLTTFLGLIWYLLYVWKAREQCS